METHDKDRLNPVEDDERPRYEPPEVVDHGSLKDLTLSGSGIGADGFGSMGGAGNS